MDVKDIFDIRYYRWMKEEARQEIVCGFPRLRRVKGWSLRFLEHVRAMSQDEQLSLVFASLKQHRGAALVGEPLTRTEAELLERSRNAQALTASPEETELQKQWLAGIKTTLQRRHLAKSVWSARPSIGHDICVPGAI